MPHSNTPPQKPKKPYPDFPLFPHATRRWAKKIRGKLHYFGPWGDPDAALRKYLDQKDDLYAGRTPRPKGEGLTVRELVNRYLTAKKLLMDAGEIRIRTFSDYYVTSDRIVNAFSKTRPVDDLDASDFERLRASMAETLGPVYLGTEIQRVRSVFKYGYDSGLIDRPVRFGPTFKPPSRKVMRQNRTVKGPRMLEAEQIRRLLDTATPQLRAMILLGVNCGFGNTDVATLPVDAVDLDDGWIDYPRPKTGVPRRCPLWQGTVQAIHEAIEVKPKPRNTADADLVFLTFLGRPWVRPGKGRSWIDSLGLQFGKLLRRLEIYRPGLNFYALRHTFETIAGDSKDQIAVDAIMGHDRGDMASVYRERISDDRLVAVAEHVRAWLFSPGA